MNVLIGLLIFLAIVVLIGAALKKFMLFSFTHQPIPHGEVNSPPSGSLIGSFGEYGAKILELAAFEGYDQFFVCCTDLESDRFVQMTAGREEDGHYTYQFDIPRFPWSEPFLEQVESSARERGLSPYDSAGGYEDKFFDIDFESADALINFSQHVVLDIFRTKLDGPFEVTWG
ncbi:hypothetical protein [Aliiroseovarius sp. PrR006]|uniref:hypothetical protein n=1 Tax=Aliiroseovarius sp. PrR006 TaxID=2706883 RepID=UPI0013D6637B|nr:hypothetical protein [Aliiroseovarius sp. PrR006]NDW52712.1 hypothetical protein [Aliiroseovarius sp. PrR006]